MARGLRPLARNVRFKGGELDLVMLDGEKRVGLLELDFRKDGECELVFFGLVAEAIGNGAGRLLSLTAKCVWPTLPLPSVARCQNG